MKIEIIAKILTSWYFINIGIPLIAAAAGIYVRVVSRKDEELKLKSDDLAIGFDIALGAVFVFLVKMVSVSAALLALPTNQNPLQADLKSKVISMPWMLLIWGIGFWGISTSLRKWGWKTVNEGTAQEPKAKYEPTAVGIILPLIFGLVSLVFAVNWTGGEG